MNHREEHDPMTGQTFGGMGGDPTARIPDAPPHPGEGSNKNPVIGLVVLAVLVVLLVFIIF